MTDIKGKPRKDKLRFYIGGSVILVLISIGLFANYIVGTKKMYDESVNNIYTTILEFQEGNLKETVERTIKDIELERSRVMNELESFYESIGTFSEERLEKIRLEDLMKAFEDIHIVDEYSVKTHWMIWDHTEEVLKYTNDEAAQNINTQEGFEAYVVKCYKYKMTFQTVLDQYTVIMGTKESDIDETVKAVSADKIRDLALEDGGYVWVDEIVNYDKVDEYAIRLVQPNLSDTEGMLLSMDEEDADVNFPFLNELEDIKKYGESTNKYYYKKKDSNELGLKLGYTKLYPRYNWMIGTGIYLEELEQYHIQNIERFEEELQKQIYMTLINFVLLLFIVLITGGLLSRYYSFKKHELLEERNKILEGHYQILGKKYDKTHEILHDVKNHLASIYCLAMETQSEQLVNYITSMNNDLLKLSHTVLTGNKMLDIILNDKMEAMQKEEIQFDYNIQDVRLDFIEDKDLVSLLANALNNAIESAKESEAKVIHFNLYAYNEALVTFKLVNSCDTMPKTKGKQLITTKDEKDFHGYGMKSMYKTAEKYGGRLSWEYSAEDKAFTLAITLPKRGDNL